MTARWTLALVIASSLAHASSQRPLSLGERARQADRVSLVEVLESHVRPPEGSIPEMTTVTTLLVREDYKGGGPQRAEVVQLGGTSGLRTAAVAGDAEFKPAETAIVFLKCRDAGQPGRCVLFGLGQGKVVVTAGPSGQEIQEAGVRRSLESAVDEIRRQMPPARPINRDSR